MCTFVFECTCVYSTSVAEVRRETEKRIGDFSPVKINQKGYVLRAHFCKVRNEQFCRRRRTIILTRSGKYFSGSVYLITLYNVRIVYTQIGNGCDVHRCIHYDGYNKINAVFMFSYKVEKK